MFDLNSKRDRPGEVSAPLGGHRKSASSSNPARQIARLFWMAVKKFPAGAERMRRYRKRRRQGIRIVRVPLRVTEINDLIRMDRLDQDQRHDPEAIQAAVLVVLHGALDELRDSFLYRARSG
jgi:hypothetical protein